MTISVSKLFQPTVLSVAGETLFTMPTTPASSVLKNARMSVCNTSASARTVSFYTSAAATAASCFVSARSIAAGETVYIDIPTMAPGDVLVGKADAAASITVHEAGGILYS
jgi:hypothetical protein